MHSSTSPTPSSQHQLHLVSSSSSPPVPVFSLTQPRSAETHTDAAQSPAPSAVASSSLLPPHSTAVNDPSTSGVGPSSSTSSSSSLPTPDAAAHMAGATTMSDAATESHGDDPSSSLTDKSTGVRDAAPSSTLTPSPVPSQLLTTHHTDSASNPPSTANPSALASATTSPGAQTSAPTSTISTLQLASEALSTIPQSNPLADSVPPAAAELLSAIHRKNKKAPAIQSPHPGLIRSRSAATTPVPSASLLLGARHDAFDVTANSSRATTPTPRTPSGRAKRQRRERNLGTPSASSLALPSIEQNDRRRSARVAQAVTTSASDLPSLPNLALFGFSPYLENLVMNAKETDRRTRSGGRGIRPPVDRAPNRVKRTAAKNKSRESDPDGPDDETKLELYRELCVISYQLQADLDMVPHKSLEQLRAQFSTPSPEEDDHDAEAKSAIQKADAGPGPWTGVSRAATPALEPSGYGQQPTPGYTQPILVKAEPPQSPPLSHKEPQPSRSPYSPESSPEVALMDTIRPPRYSGHPQHPAYPQGPYPTHHEPQHEPYGWTAKVDEPEDEPMSPVFRPARSNIMSISALMSGPSPVKQRSPSPELIQTPPRPIEPLPTFMQEWTYEDEMASQFLQACADAIPKLDTTELDRLTQIAQLAAFDLEIASVSSTPRSSTPSLVSPFTEQKLQDAHAKFDPKRLNPLDTLDTQKLYDREEAHYLEESQANDELYEIVHYLSSFDQVVDEWRAGELARLRLQLEMRKAEVDRIWTCDRKLAWSTFIDNRAGELYRKAMAKASRSKWQAEMELDLLEVHRRKTRGLAKLTKDILVPEVEGLEHEEIASLYERYGKFVSAAKYASHDEPLVRADIRKLRTALRAHRRQEQRDEKVAATQADSSTGEKQEQADHTAGGGSAAMATDSEAHLDVVSSSESEVDEASSDDDYASDSSSASSSSGISSLPSFTSVYSSPRLPSIADIAIASDLNAVVSEAASTRGAAEDDSDEDADESLWARQIRLANQLAEQSTAPSAVASGVQTPAVVVDESQVNSQVPSRVASPALSTKAQARKQRERKRKKRPPPPGARLWKKGRVQQDADGEPVEEAPPSQQQHQQEPKTEPQNGTGLQNGYTHHHDTHLAVEKPYSRPSSPKMRPAPPMDGYDYRREHDPYPHQDRYAMRPSYLNYAAREEYDYAPSFSRHLDPYDARSYGAYAPPAAYPSYARGGYEVEAPMYGTRAPPEGHWQTYEYDADGRGGGGYPSHPPPPLPQQQQQQQVRPSWPY